MIKTIKKIGLSNFIAFLSFVVAGFAFFESYKANKPVILVKDLPVYSVGTYKDSEARCLSLFRFLISNAGGRAVSLNTISIPKEVEPVLGTAPDNKTVKPIRSAYFFKINSTQITENTTYDALLERQPNDYILQREDYIVKKKIEPGETLDLAIGFEYRDQYPEIDQLLIYINANFSDGTVVPIRAAIDARIKRRGR